MKRKQKVYCNFAQLMFLLVISDNVTAKSLTHEKCFLQSSDCLKKQAQAALHVFVLGMPELGIKKFDRLHLDDVNVETQEVTYQMWNIRIGGFNNSIIDDLSIKLPLKLMRLNFHTTLLVDSDYKLGGFLFGLPVSGEGKYSMILQKLQMEFIFMFDIVKNEGSKDIMNITNYMHGFDALDGVHYYFENMYNGDKKKTDVFHGIMNSSWRTIIANFGKFFTAKISKDVFEAIQKYMRSRPLEDFANY